MARHAVLRKFVLKEIYRRSGGDLDVLVSLTDVAASLKISAQDAETVASQLVGKQLIAWPHGITERTGMLTMPVAGDVAEPLHVVQVHAPINQVRMRIQGVEEVERMEEPLFQRLPRERPLLFGAINGLVVGVVVGLVMLFAGRFLDRVWPQSPPAKEKASGELP